jgi:hypothetical protein
MGKTNLKNEFLFEMTKSQETGIVIKIWRLYQLNN